MKKLLLSFLLFTGAAFAVPESPDQLKKLEDEHGVIPGKQIPEIPPEQANITEVTDPEEDKDKLN